MTARPHQYTHDRPRSLPPNRGTHFPTRGRGGHHPAPVSVWENPVSRRHNPFPPGIAVGADLRVRPLRRLRLRESSHTPHPNAAQPPDAIDQESFIGVQVFQPTPISLSPRLLVSQSPCLHSGGADILVCPESRSGGCTHPPDRTRRTNLRTPTSPSASRTRLKRQQERRGLGPREARQTVPQVPPADRRPRRPPNTGAAGRTAPRPPARTVRSESMRRHLFTLASAVSLLLCLATVVLWVRSYAIRDELFCGNLKLHSAISVSASSNRGILSLSRTGPSRSSGLYWDCFAPNPLQTSGMFGIVRRTTGPSHLDTFYFPIVVLSGLFALLHASWVVMKSRDGTRHASCRSCGYDLTGNTSGICPECGSAVEAKVKVGA